MRSARTTALRGGVRGALVCSGLSVVMHAAAFAAVPGPSPAHALSAERATFEVEVESVPEPPAAPTPVPSAPDPEPAPLPNRAAAATIQHREATAGRPPPAVSAPVAPAPTPAAAAPEASAVAPIDAPPVAAASDDALPHFAIAAPARTAVDAPSGRGQPPAPAELSPDAPYGESAVDVPARAAAKVRPTYPFDAQTSGLEATVELEIVLSKTGHVESVRSLNHPGHGFEKEAIAAVRSTPFTPARRRGLAVPVRMAWSVEFRLQ